MTTYYVSPSGSDSNNGLGPNAAHASNKPWLTVGKALGASGIASGDTVYIAPGTYREAVTVAMTSATGETFVLGDPQNTQGFKDGSGVLLTPGPVYHSSWATDDYSIMSTSSTLTLNGRDYLTFRDICFLGGNTSYQAVNATTTLSTNITFTRCMFMGGNQAVYVLAATTTADNALVWVIENCIFLSGANSAIYISIPTSASADYDINFIIRNNLFLSMQYTLRCDPSGAGSFKGGGAKFLNNTIVGIGANAILANGANLSTTYPILAYNNLVLMNLQVGGGFSATTLGQIVEDYNVLVVQTARSNVAVGKNSRSSLLQNILLECGQSFLWGFASRPIGMPVPGSTLLGYGNQSSSPTTDLLGRIRPAGKSDTKANSDTGTATAGGNNTLTDSGKSWGTNAWAGYAVEITGGTGVGQIRYVQSNTSTVLTTTQNWATNPSTDSTYSLYNGGKLPAIGCYERHDTASKETTVYDAADASIKLVGPSDQDIYIPVNAESTTISIKARYDSTTYGGTNYPQAILLPNGSIGVSTETETATVAASDAWETLTFSAMTPTAKGVVTVRLVNRTNDGDGICYFDTLSVS